VFRNPIWNEDPNKPSERASLRAAAQWHRSQAEEGTERRRVMTVMRWSCALLLAGTLAARASLRAAAQWHRWQEKDD
jgi:hypothetical protein